MSPSDLVSPTSRDVATDTRVPPAGIEVGLLKPADGMAARNFCLDTILEVYGHGYRPDWHADLDSLASGDHGYLPDEGGAFLVAHRDGEIIGTAGLRCLATAPKVCERFADRYPSPAKVGSIWRTYLEPSLRSKGIGATLSAELEYRAAELGYRRLYLHTSSNTPRALSFWQGQGYGPFAADDDTEATVHLDKTLS